MIDFRYHVVSLVAVFLALATGIVIGGFSLRGEVADQLHGQVAGLRTDKADLQSQLTQASTGNKKRDEAVTDLAPKVLAGSLPGQRVAVVALPGVEDSLTKNIKTTITSGGGQVVATVTLSDKWTDAAYATSDSMRQHAGTLGISTSDVRPDRLAGAVLARALARQDGGARNVLKDFSDGDATTVEPSQAPPATSIVLVWPGMVDKAGIVKKWSGLVSGVGISVTAVVGVSSGSASTDKGPTPDALISSVRETPDVVSVMSTIDDGAIPIGQIALGLALRDELAGKSGQYGLGRDASALLPRVTPAAATEPPS